MGKLNNLMDVFVEEMDVLSLQITEMAIPSGDSSKVVYDKGDLAFLSSLFESSRYTFSEIYAHINRIKAIINELKAQINSREEIPTSIHCNRVTELDKNSAFIRVANAASIPEDYSVKAQVAHYKEIEKLIFAYRSLILEFNACVTQYNVTNKGIYPELKPFASVDMSPLL